MLIQCPPRPYHLEIDSSTQSKSDGLKLFARYLLKFATKSSTCFHRSAELALVPSGSSGQSLHLSQRQISSNLHDFIPVLLKAWTGRYSHSPCSSQSFLRSRTSVRVMRIMRPKNLRSSPFVISRLLFARRFLFVRLSINVICSGGNMSRKESSRERLFPESDPG